MNKLNGSVCAVLFVMAVGVIVAVPSLRAEQQVVANAGFEQAGVAGKPAGWGTVGAGKYSWVTGVAGRETHSGVHAISISGVAANAPINCRWVQLSSDLLVVRPGQKQTVSLWARGDYWDVKKDGYRLYIEYFSSTNAPVGNWLSSKSVNLLKEVGVWENQIHDVDAAPVGAAYAKISLVFGRLPGSSSVDPTITFDDVSVVVAE